MKASGFRLGFTAAGLVVTVGLSSTLYRVMIDAPLDFIDKGVIGAVMVTVISEYAVGIARAFK